MRNAQFMNLATGVFDRCMAVMEGKSAEYSRGHDKLHNFKRAAAMIESERFRHEPEDALVGMWVKHLVSIFDMVDDLPDLPSIGLLREKMTDAINYLVLLEALFMERMDRPEECENCSDQYADKILDEIEMVQKRKRAYEAGEYPDVEMS